MYWNEAFTKFPLVAILRGVTPSNILSIVEVLIKEGFVLIEIPLNSHDALESIRLAVSIFGKQAIFGAGTVIRANDVSKVADVGGRLIVAPNFDLMVAKEARQNKLIYCPGVVTPTEAFLALDAGANLLKLFPAEMILPPTIRALRAVLPTTARLLPVGGIVPENMQAYFAAGANGFGIGSALYQPSLTLEEIRKRASSYRQALSSLMI